MALETSLYPDVFNDRLFNRACHLVKDAVPNIRMTIAKCFSLVLTKQTIDTHRHMVTVMILRRMQQDEDSDVRDIALSCELPATDEEINESARDLHETVSIDDTRTNLSSLSTTSTVDLNSTEGGVAFGHDNDESDESQDSIRLYLDTDEKNMSKSSCEGKPEIQVTRIRQQIIQFIIFSFRLQATKNRRQLRHYKPNSYRRCRMWRETLRSKATSTILLKL